MAKVKKILCDERCNNCERSLIPQKGEIMNTKVTIKNPTLTKADRLYAVIQDGINELKKHSKNGYNPKEDGLLIYVPESLSQALFEPISYLVDHLPIIDQTRELYPFAVITTSPLSYTMTGVDDVGAMKPLNENKVVCMARLPSICPFAFEEFVEIELDEEKN